MASLDQLKQTFFDECDEALQQIEAGLTDIREGQGSDETVNAVFRGVHSVKGGAGIFGFEALVGFAHVFETLLDGVRRGSLQASPETLDVLLTASDVLSDLVQMSRAGKPIAAGFGAECRSALERIIDGDKAGAAAEDDNAPAPADFDGIDFTPVRVDFDGGSDVTDAMRSYTITFRPKPEMLKKANEPLYLLRELAKLGELDLVAQTDRLPALTEMEPDHPYIWWTGTLQSKAPRAQIDEVFEFVVGDCDLEIVDTSAPAAGIVEIADAPGIAPPQPTGDAPPPPRATPAERPAPSAAPAEHPEAAATSRSAAAKALADKAT